MEGKKKNGGSSKNEHNSTNQLYTYRNNNHTSKSSYTEFKNEVVWYLMKGGSLEW